MPRHGTRGKGLPNPSRETKFSGANGNKEKIIFPIQLTTSRIGNLTRLILTLVALCDDLIIYIYKSATDARRVQILL